MDTCLEAEEYVVADKVFKALEQSMRVGTISNTPAEKR
jgi:hypothetical protein